MIAYFLSACASADSSRYFSIPFHKDSSEVYFQQLRDSLPQLGFVMHHDSKDTLIAKTYIKQGALNEREIVLTLLKDIGECKMFVQTITYFRQDTIIEYYDAHRGFPASYRKDFNPALNLAKRIGKQTLKKRK
jgi:hypothetical protein